ncbi:MAG TPA: c-type cytochrome [Candidatus Binatia bacterium]|nr:c-type cytochrome [Candidatus Binatia bacterium]
MMAKRAVIVAGIAVFGILLSRAQAQSGAASGSAPKKAEEQYKNIQVLKGIPADQLVPAMQFISASLGVECEFCHVQGAFEKDDKKPKQTARSMMQMMFAINADDFDRNREVTCYTCHRGNEKPVSMPPVMAAEIKPTAPVEVRKPVEMPEAGAAAAPSGPPADQLFDKFIQASGGAAAIDKITSREMKGTITFGDSNIPIEIFSKDPGKRISFSHTPDGDNITAFDGQSGWLRAPNRPPRDMHGPDLDAAAMDADLHFATHLRSMFSQAQVGDTEVIDGHDVYLVEGKRLGKTPLRLYFDERSGLLLRLIRFGDTPLGELPTQIDYADYRDAGGVKIPYRWTLARPGGRFTIQLSEVKENAPVDDSKFAKPAVITNPDKRDK